MTIAQNFKPTLDIPGRINSNGVKEPIQSEGDSVEVSILEFLSTRPEGSTAGRMRSDKKALKGIPLEEVEEYLSVLVAEGKVTQDGSIYRAVDRP